MAACMRANFLCKLCLKYQNSACSGGFSSLPWLILNGKSLGQPVRHATNKHWDPKWRKERFKKFIKIDLPNYEKIRSEAKMSPEELRSESKRQRMKPPRAFQERNLLIASTNTVFEPYVPPEGDGIASPISKDGAKQRFTEMEKKGKSYLQLRKIRQYEEDFDSKEFAKEAQDIYIKAQSLLQDIKKNEDQLHELVSEKAYPDMTWKLDRTTFRWKFLESLEAPRVVHVRTTDLLSKDNVYGQVTVRLHTRQILAIYDRFGRLTYGSEHLAKDCLEYVVLEKHLSDEYGLWRIHGKIIPDWMPPRQPILRTVRKPKFEPIKDIGKDTEEKTLEKKDEGTGGTEGLAMA